MSAGTGFRTATVYSRRDCQGQRHYLLVEGQRPRDKLDRAQVSALAKRVIRNQLSWLEAQSRLDDWIDAATLPTFGVGNGAIAKAPVAASAKPMTERTSDPMDERQCTEQRQAARPTHQCYLLHP